MLSIIAAAFAMLLMLFQFFYIGIILKKQAERESNEIASLTAREIAQTVQVYFRDALTVTETYADNLLVYKQNNIQRHTIYKLMKGSLTLNDNFLAIWTMWEQNAYDNKDYAFANDEIHDPKGSFAITYYYDNGVIKQEINDTSDFYEDFYTIPKKYKKAVILDPFYYQYHGNEKVYFETSMISPIINEGAFLGVIGIDIDLYELQHKFRDKVLYDSGYISILSNSGQIVTHKYEKFVTRNISEFIDTNLQSVTDSLTLGKTFVTHNTSMISDEESYRYFFPINMEYMAAPWYIMIEIPQSAILKKANSLKFISLLVLLASLILLLYLVFNIIDQRIKEKTLIENFNELKKSDQRLNEAYHALDKNKQILEAIFNQTFSFVGLLSIESNLLAINSPALLFIDKKESDVIGLPFAQTPWWKDSPDIGKLQEAIVQARNNQHISFETSHLNLKGEYIPFLFSIKPITGNQNEVQFLLAEGIDISKIKEAERELDKYRQHLEYLVKERTEELAATNEELSSNNETLYYQKQELEKILEDLKQTQEQLLQSRKMASLGILSAGIAHEINNPLNFIQSGLFGLNDYLTTHLPEHTANLTHVIDAIQEGVTRASKIVTSLNHYSRQNSTERVKCDIGTIIDNCLVMLHNSIKNRIAVEKNYQQNEHHIIGNEGQLHQAFLNILANAAQSISGNGKITIELKPIANRLHVVFTDTGSGISKNDLPNVFDPFFTTKDPGKGTGLGLSITFNIIKEHQGNIELDSELGIGTTVKIIFPL